MAVKKQGPPRSGEGQTLLCFLAGDLVDSGNQSQQSPLYFLVGQAPDALLPDGVDLLAGIDIPLGRPGRSIQSSHRRKIRRSNEVFLAA